MDTTTDIRDAMADVFQADIEAAIGRHESIARARRNLADAATRRGDTATAEWHITHAVEHQWLADEYRAQLTDAGSPFDNGGW